MTIYIPEENRNVSHSEIAKWPEGPDESDPEFSKEDLEEYAIEAEERFEAFLDWMEVCLEPGHLK